MKGTTTPNKTRTKPEQNPNKTRTKYKVIRTLEKNEWDGKNNN